MQYETKKKNQDSSVNLKERIEIIRNPERFLIIFLFLAAIRGYSRFLFFPKRGERIVPLFFMEDSIVVVLTIILIFSEDFLFRV